MVGLAHSPLRSLVSRSNRGRGPSGLLLLGEQRFTARRRQRDIMEPAITVAVIAAVVSGVGWVVNYILSSRSERQRVRLASKLAHIQKQLELLYGPLAFLVLEGKRTFDDLLEKLGRRYIFATPSSELPAAELDLWLFWVDYDLMPRNLEIKNSLATHADLIVGPRLPASYIRFLDHHNSWYMEHQRWKEQQIPYTWHSKINWPHDFEDEVLSTFSKLMEEHAELIGTIGETGGRRFPKWRRDRRSRAGLAPTSGGMPIP
jgi:hypothetical protein